MNKPIHWEKKKSTQRCSVPFPKEGSVPHPYLQTFPSFSTMVDFENYSSPLATPLCVATQDCCCPNSASSLAGQILNVTLRKMQLLNFSWRATALFLGFLELCVSSGADITEENNVNNDVFQGYLVKVCLQRIRISQRVLSSKLMVAAGFIIFCRIPATLFTLFCITTTLFSAESRRLPMFCSSLP